jgi:hypothetical protein
MSKTPFNLPFESANLFFPRPTHTSSSNSVDFLPFGFNPTGKDIICGRARENFHHGKHRIVDQNVPLSKDVEIRLWSHPSINLEDGNRYFRDLIQQNVGPYLAARKRIEKSEAIALIVDKVHQASPYGGFIRKDSATGRWYRIKDSEARDKVGHAIRKAVQRLEETKPKLAARIKKDYMDTVSSSQPEQEGKPPAHASLSPKAASTQRSSLVLSEHEHSEDGTSSPRVATVEPAGSSETLRRFAGTRGLAPSNAMISNGLQHDTTKLAIEQLLGGSSSTRAAFSARNMLAGFPAMANSLPGHNVSVFPSPGNIATMEDPTRLVATTLLAHRAGPLSQHAYNQYIGMHSAPASANKLWLTAALRQQQQSYKVKELEYARRLAMTALQDLSQSKAPSSGDEARTQARKASIDGEDKTSRS